MKAAVNWPVVYQKTALIIDDSGTMRELIAGLLRECGCKKVKKASCGDDGIRAHKDESVGITFLDIDMPEKDGFEVLKEIKEHNKDAFIVMLSSHSTPDNVKEALSSGANGFIVKPCSQNKIKEALENFARQSNIVLD